MFVRIIKFENYVTAQSSLLYIIQHESVSKQHYTRRIESETLQWRTKGMLQLSFSSLLFLSSCRDPSLLKWRRHRLDQFLSYEMFSCLYLWWLSNVFLLQSYIVYLGGHPQAPEGASPMVEEQRKDAHYELLGNVLGR